MTNEAFRDAKPARPVSGPAARRSRLSGSRPLERAGAWAKAQRVRIKPPTRRTTYWIGGVLAVIAVAIGILIAIWDWNWFRGPVARLASAKMHREVTITGDLNANIWSFRPSATVDGVRIANPDWAGGGAMADIERIAIRIRLLPLLIGQVDLRLLRFDRPDLRLYRDARGRANWDFSDGRKAAEPMRLPPIRNFIVRDGRLRYNDAKRDVTFNGLINAAEKAKGRNRGFELTGTGAFNRAPFRLSVTGGPLINIKRNEPYPFDADLQAGDTFITARGAVNRPFDLGHVYANATARGPDLAHLYALTGVALPNTPPYNLRGRLERDDQMYKITGLGGRVGGSDLAGAASVQTGLARPLLKAELSSRSLDFADLIAIFGGAPTIRPGQAVSPAQKATAQQLSAQQRIFPDATLKVDRIRSMDADVTYRAVSIRGAPINLESGSVRLKLDAGLLRADPLTLGLPKGQIAGRVLLDARKATPVTDLDLRLTNARLEQLVPIKSGGPQPLTGSLVGRARLRGAGDSVHKAFSAADGEVMVVVQDGQIRKVFAELLGVNVTKALGLIWGKNEENTQLRCAVAHFQTRDGVMTADQLIIDTGPVLATGKGTINLGSERMDLQIKGRPKKFRLVSLNAPITVKGPLSAPKPGVEVGGAVAQGGIAVALGALLSPLAAILPFVDAGLAKDAACGALIAEAGRDGVPVKTVSAARR